MSFSILRDSLEPDLGVSTIEVVFRSESGPGTGGGQGERGGSVG